MNLYQTKLFTTFQKQYKNQFGVDISQFVKLTNSSINFAQFEEKHLTVKQKNVIKNIQKNNKKIILSGGIASGKKYLACYLYTPAYKARVLLGEWIASTDSIFTEINFTQDFVFTSSVAYLDPSFSVGGDNTALCVMEKFDDKYIVSLITPFTYKKLYIVNYSSVSVFNDIYYYRCLD